MSYAAFRWTFRLTSRSPGNSSLGIGALAEWDAKGWDALPLAPKELSRLFPALRQTAKAAERWTAKNPPEAIRDIIRVWGVLNSYRRGWRSRGCWVCRQRTL